MSCLSRKKVFLSSDSLRISLLFPLLMKKTSSPLASAALTKLLPRKYVPPKTSILIRTTRSFYFTPANLLASLSFFLLIRLLFSLLPILTASLLFAFTYTLAVFSFAFSSGFSSVLSSTCFTPVLIRSS